jgi:Uma2 family endonuclease
MTAHKDRNVIRGVDWASYEKLLEAVGDRGGLRLAYDGKDLEIISPSPLHENIKVLAGRFVETVADELEIAYRSMASTTWKRLEVERGIEADQCFYFRTEKLTQAAAALNRKSNDIADYPIPDLAIEIDISPSQIDRPGIYAALDVPEVWRIDASSLTIERLNYEKAFGAVSSSRFLPVEAHEVARWVLEEDAGDIAGWTRRLRAWIRAELLSRPRGGQP